MTQQKILRELEKIRSQALSILASYDRLVELVKAAPAEPAPAPVDVGEFVALVVEETERHFDEAYEYDRELLEKLYRESGGDVETVTGFIAKLGDRYRKTGWRPDNLHAWVMGVIRKQGLPQIRAEVQRFRAQSQPSPSPSPSPLDSTVLVEEVVNGVLAQVGAPAGD